ncbi:MAG: class I adenylate cyclase [Desulfobacterales bacterium]|nr:class I adenylate cyclase [Desulfobacterales bacterium]
MIAKATVFNKKSFVFYNISRLRELIRYLPPKKFELFNTIPFLLHINSPKFTGYMENHANAYGIYGFNDSGFWRLTLKRFNLSEGEMISYTSRLYCIKGLYLMGSSGTIAQTNYSDFDYWVIVDDKTVTKEQLTILNKKLDVVKKWSEANYSQSVNFFIMGINQLKENNFSSVDEESSGSSQRTILKEEFYRTFIMIGGKIPYWAVLPVGLDDASYKKWIKLAKIAKHHEFNSEDYIDLGNVAHISTNECIGALIWQIYKAHHDPVKAFMKSSVVANYYQNTEETLMCDIIKKKFSQNNLESNYLTDPYVIVFEKIINFYKNSFNEDDLELAKTCIFLRLSGYPISFKIDENSPKLMLINKYIKEWYWDEEKIYDLKNYIEWGEAKHKKFEDDILIKINKLYEQMLDKSNPILDMSKSDITILKNKIKSFTEEKENKIPFASAYLRAIAPELSFFITCQYDERLHGLWTVYDERKGKKQSGQIFFIGHFLLEFIGWIILNGFVEAKKKIEVNNYPISGKRIIKFIDEVSSFFSDKNHINWELSQPVFNKMIILLNTIQDKDSYDKILNSCDFLIKNSWSELYFESINLTKVENQILKCYEIAVIMWKYFKNSSGNIYEYKFVRLDAGIEDNTRKTVEDFLFQFKNENFDKDITLNISMLKEEDNPTIFDEEDEWIEEENSFLLDNF